MFRCHPRHLAVLAALCLSTRIAVAAVFTVNSEADVPDANPGNGVCNPEFALPGVCSLRAAVMEANALPGSDVIVLTPGQTYRLTRAGKDDTALNGDLDINGSVTFTVSGAGVRPVVDADGIDRAFDFRIGFVGMSGFDITGGKATDVDDDKGGAIRLTTVQGALLTGMRLHGNQAIGGGAIYSVSDLTLRDSELFGNDGFGGSAINLLSGTLWIDRSSVFGNTCANEGAAEAIDIQNSAVLILDNSTISSNLGYGVFALNSGDVTLRNSTIVGNSTRGFFMNTMNNATLTMDNVVIANNGQLDCDHDLLPNIAYDTDGYNIDSDGSCFLAGGATNLPSGDPLLTPLKARGGSTPLHWPRPDSPLLEAGNPLIAADGCSNVDQHFLQRPQDFGLDGTARCDIGAAEVPADAIFYDSNETLP